MSVYVFNNPSERLRHKVSFKLILIGFNLEFSFS